VVLLEVQIHPDPSLPPPPGSADLPLSAAAVPSGALRLFLDQVLSLNLEALSQESNLDPLLNLLTLPIRPERQSRPAVSRSLPAVQFFILLFFLELAGVLREEIRRTCAVQGLLAEGRQQEAAFMTFRLLIRRCAPLNEANSARIHALPLSNFSPWPTPFFTSRAWPLGCPPTSEPLDLARFAKPFACLWLSPPTCSFAMCSYPFWGLGPLTV
jgi:hypothetical protein